MKTAEKLNILDGIDDKFITEAFPHRLFKIGAVPKKDKTAISERHPVRMIESFVSVAAIFLVIGMIFVWTLVGKDIINAYHGEDTTNDMTTTEPQTTPTPATTTDNGIVPPIPSTDTTTKPWHTTAPITTTQPITKPLPEVTYEILIIDGEYYLKIIGADAYECPTDALSRSMVAMVSFASVEEMFDKIVNNKLTQEQLIHMYYFLGGRQNEGVIKIFDLGNMILPKTNYDGRLFSFKSFEREEATWEGDDYYSYAQFNSEYILTFVVFQDDNIDRVLQQSWNTDKKFELQQIERPDGTVREEACIYTDKEMAFVERFVYEENDKKYYAIFEYNYDRIKQNGNYSYRVIIEEDDMYYKYTQFSMEHEKGFIEPTTRILTLDELRELSYEKIPYVAK